MMEEEADSEEIDRHSARQCNRRMRQVFVPVKPAHHKIRVM